MGRLARTRGEHHRMIVRHSPDGHTQGMDRPALLQECPASNDLRHDRFNGGEAVKKSSHIQPTGNPVGVEKNRLRSTPAGKDNRTSAG